MRFVLLVLIFLASPISSARSGEVNVAVASNFLGPLKEIALRFEKQTGHKAILISGSTGKLYAQIKNGAPFDLFLAADSLRPALLEKEGFAVSGSSRTYAIGRLALWSRDPKKIQGDAAKNLKERSFNHLAIASPKTAPYGRAALQTLKKLGVWDQVQERVVQGENIGQTFQFVATGNADLGFVALSQILNSRNKFKGSRWEVPATFHDPIQQDLVFLKHGESNSTARELIKFIESDAIRKLIEELGYRIK